MLDASMILLIRTVHFAQPDDFVTVDTSAEESDETACAVSTPPSYAEAGSSERLNSEIIVTGLRVFLVVVPEIVGVKVSAAEVVGVSDGVGVKDGVGVSDGVPEVVGFAEVVGVMVPVAERDAVTVRVGWSRSAMPWSPISGA